MDLISLIVKAPRLHQQLKKLDLESSTIIKLGGELNEQLRKHSGPDLTDLLTHLDMQGFQAMVDIDQLSSITDVDRARAGLTVMLLGEVVEAFQGDPDTLV